ncbi:hypothetical protein [Croceimicrobium sp.]|uniref:hypothetical protein n=1 Tax=Croceimicrobium sp. TaxID=2828340 RepID=UPI003BAB4D84
MKGPLNQARLYPLFLLLSTFLVYLEWGGAQRAFLVEMEVQLFRDLFQQPEHFAHPLILLPLFGQLLLIFLILKPQAKRLWPMLSIISIGLLLLFVLLGALLKWNPLMLLSVMPFMLISLLWMIKYSLIHSEPTQTKYPDS